MKTLEIKLKNDYYKMIRKQHSNVKKFIVEAVDHYYNFKNNLTNINSNSDEYSSLCKVLDSIPVRLNKDSDITEFD